MIISVYLFVDIKKLIVLKKCAIKNSEEKETNELLSKAFINLGICCNKIELSRYICIICGTDINN